MCQMYNFYRLVTATQTIKNYAKVCVVLIGCTLRAKFRKGYLYSNHAVALVALSAEKRIQRAWNASGNS